MKTAFGALSLILSYRFQLRLWPRLDGGLDDPESTGCHRYAKT